MSTTHTVTASRPAPEWSEPDWSAPDLVQRFRDHIRALLGHRFAKGQTVDDTEARALLRAAAQMLRDLP